MNTDKQALKKKMMMMRKKKKKEKKEEEKEDIVLQFVPQGVGPDFQEGTPHEHK